MRTCSIWNTEHGRPIMRDLWTVSRNCGDKGLHMLEIVKWQATNNDPAVQVVTVAVKTNEKSVRYSEAFRSFRSHGRRSSYQSFYSMNRSVRRHVPFCTVENYVFSSLNTNSYRTRRVKVSWTRGILLWIWNEVFLYIHELDKEDQDKSNSWNKNYVFWMNHCSWSNNIDLSWKTDAMELLQSLCIANWVKINSKKIILMFINSWRICK